MSAPRTRDSQRLFTRIKRPYLFLLIPLVLLLAVQPLAAEDIFPVWGLRVLEVLLMLATVNIVRSNRVLFGAAAFFLVLSVIGMLGVDLFGEGRTVVIAEYFNVGGVIALFTITALFIAAEAIHEESITLDTLLGAVSVYLLIGLSFSFGYVLLESSHAGAFAGLPEVAGASSKLLFADLSYYSLVTITTLGYGDISPVHPLARSLATMEAVFGQFFVAAVVGLLVSRKTSEPAPAK